MNSKIITIEKALLFKIRAAHYHKTMSMRSGLNKITNYMNNEVSAMEFTAMMNTLHPILDIIAQWINEKHALKIPDNRVSFHLIIQKINKPEIISCLKKLQKETKYLSDFCNYTKHRNIIKVNHQSFFLSSMQPSSTLTIQSFKHSQIKHTPQSLCFQRKKQFKLIYNAIEEITGIYITLADNNLIHELR